MTPWPNGISGSVFPRWFPQGRCSSHIMDSSSASAAPKSRQSRGLLAHQPGGRVSTWDTVVGASDCCTRRAPSHLVSAERTCLQTPLHFNSWGRLVPCKAFALYCADNESNANPSPPLGLKPQGQVCSPPPSLQSHLNGFVCHFCVSRT